MRIHIKIISIVRYMSIDYDKKTYGISAIGFDFLYLSRVLDVGLGCC